MNKILKNKQLLSIFLLLIYLFNGLSSIVVFAESSGKSSAEDFVIEDGSLIKYKGSGGDIVIPNDVTVIKEGVFRDKKISSVKLPNSLIEIEDFAFSVNSIEEVIIPANVKKIGSYAFSDNEITKVVLNKENISLGKGVFADNKIAAINLENITNIPEQAFLNNKIKELKFSTDLQKIGSMAFAINNLEGVVINSLNSSLTIADDAFIYNEQMVGIKTSNKNIDSSNIRKHGFGHIVNPVNIKVRYLKEVGKDKYAKLMDTKELNFNPIDVRTIFSLNKESYYLPEDIYNHEVVNKNITEDGYIKFIPDKNGYELTVIYKELPGPKIVFDEDKVQEIQKNKIEGDSISREDLLELIKATNRNGEDITNKVIIDPENINNIENRSYAIRFTVQDKGQSYEVVRSLIFAENPLLAKIGKTEWIYGDFVYDGSKVVKFSDSGKAKLNDTNIDTIGIPGINPHTGDSITELHLGEGDFGITDSLFLNKGHITNIEIENPDALTLIGERSFENANIKSIPEMPKLEIIEDYAFYNSSLGGNISIPNISFVGNHGLRAKRDSSNPMIIADKSWNNLSNLGRYALSNVYFGKHKDNSNMLPEMPNLTQAGEYAFGKHPEFTGVFPIMESLKIIPTYFISEAKNLDIRDSFPNVEIINAYGLKSNNLVRGFPKLRKVKRINNEAFMETHGAAKEGFLPPEFESLEYSDYDAFFASSMRATDFKYLQNLKEFNENSLPGVSYDVGHTIPNKLPSLEIIGAQAWTGPGKTFYTSPIRNEFVPEIPNIRILKSAAMESTTMKGVFGEKGFGDWPELEYIGSTALASKNISGKLPYFPKLKEIDVNAFREAKIDKSHEFVVNSDIKIAKDAFRGIEPSGTPIIIRTIDGKPAPNIKPSPYHVVNPQNIIYVGLDENGEEIIKKRVLVSEIGEGLRVFYENVVGYKVDSLEEFIDVNKDNLENNTVYVNYKKLPEGIKEDNEYHLSVDSETTSLNVDELATFDIVFRTMKDFKNDGEIHDIVVEYNPDVVSEISSTKGVDFRLISPGKAIIRQKVDKNSSFTFPINYKVKNGFVKDTYADFKVSLEKPGGYERFGQTLNRKINYSKPFYQSLFTKDKVNSETISRLVSDINNYIIEFKTSIQPEMKSIVRDFNKIAVRYKAVEYDSLEGYKIAELSKSAIADGWKYDEVNKEYYYEKIDNLFYDIEKMPIPKLELVFKNAKSQNLVIESYTDLDVNTSSEEDKSIKLFSKNYLDISIEERSGDIIITNIDTPRNQEGSRFSYFYEGSVDKSKDFNWKMEYFFPNKFDRFEIDLDLPKDHNIEKISIDDVPSDKVVGQVLFFNERGAAIIKEPLKGSYTFNPAYDGFSKIKLVINDENILGSDSIKVNHTTKFDWTHTPKYDHIDSENNRFTQNYKTSGIIKDEEPFIIEDSTYSEMRKTNRTVFASVRDFSDSESIIKGDGGTILYGIGSHDYLETNITELEYDILIDSSHSVEFVQSLVAKNGYFSYEIIENYNNSGKTLIKTKFKDLDLTIKDLKGEESAVTPVISVKLSNNDLSSTKLETYAMIKESKHHEIYYQGNGMVEGIDLSKYSVDRKEANISIPEYFHINKKIKHNGFEKQEIVTEANERFSYVFNLFNKEKTEKKDFILVDVLPFTGDFNGSNNTNLLDLEEIKNLKLPAGFNIEYFDTNISDIKKDTLVEDYQNKIGSSTPTKDTTVIKITADKIGNNKLSIEIPMISSPAKDEELVTINKFAFHHSELGYDQGFSNEVVQKISALPKLRDVEFKKVYSENGTTIGPLEGAEFILVDKDLNILGSAVSDKDGLVKFKNIDVSLISEVIETITPLGYDKVKPIAIKDMKFKDINGVYVGEDVVNKRKVDYTIHFKALEVDDIDLEYSEIPKKGYTVAHNSLNEIKLKLTNINTGKTEILSLQGHSQFKYSNKALPFGNYKVEFFEYGGGKDIEHIFEENLKDYYMTINENGLYYSENDSFAEEGLLFMNEDTFFFPITRFPNVPNGDFVKIVKVDKDGNKLPGAEFEVVINYNNPPGVSPNGDVVYNRVTDENGVIYVEKESSYISSIKVKETKAPNGYYIDNPGYITIPAYGAVNYLEVKNEKLELLVRKYKIIANNVSYEEALELQRNFETTDGGRVHLETSAPGLYTVKEVWEDNEIRVINGDKEAVSLTNTKGVANNIENDLGGINIDENIVIKDETDITSHYRAATKTINPQDYIKREDFDGTIKVDLEILPRFGSVYVSKYVLSKLNTPTKGDAVNGTKFALLEEKDGQFVSIEEKTIDNGSFIIFDGLKPEKNYKVEEIEASEGYNISEDNIRDVVINSNNSYIDRLIFRNYADAEVGSLNIKKIDGRTGQSIEGVEFTIFNSDGEVIESRYTNKDGEIEFLDLLVDQADFTIKETKAAPGYRLATEEIVATLDDILEGKTFTVKNYKYNETPKTGTSGKLPFFLISIPLIALAYVFRKKKY